MVGAQRAHQFEHAGAGHARSERALGGELVGQSIGERVRKRHTQFKKIDSVCEDGAAGGERGVEIRIAGAKVGDERCAILGAGAEKGLGNAVHTKGRKSKFRRLTSR